MPDLALQNALHALTAARDTLSAKEDAVWKEVQRVAPAFATRLRDLGFDDRAAAEWMCQLGNGDRSPADEILAGRSEALLAWLERGMEGFIG